MGGLRLPTPAWPQALRAARASFVGHTFTRIFQKSHPINFTRTASYMCAQAALRFPVNTARPSQRGQTLGTKLQQHSGPSYLQVIHFVDGSYLHKARPPLS